MTVFVGQKSGPLQSSIDDFATLELDFTQYVSAPASLWRKMREAAVRFFGVVKMANCAVKIVHLRVICHCASYDGLARKPCISATVTYPLRKTTTDDD